MRCETIDSKDMRIRPMRGCVGPFNGSDFFYWSNIRSPHRLRIHHTQPPEMQSLADSHVELGLSHVRVFGRNRLQLEQDLKQNHDILFLGFQSLLPKSIRGRPLEVYSSNNNLLTQRIFMDHVSDWKNKSGDRRLGFKGFTILYPGDKAILLNCPVGDNTSEEIVKITISNNPESSMTSVET